MVIQGSPLTSEYKKAIVSVKKYFDRTKCHVEEQKCSSGNKIINKLGSTITVKVFVSVFLAKL